MRTGSSKRYHIIIFALLGILSGCQTSYQPAINPASGKPTATGGYLDRELNEGIFEIEFIPNGHTDKERSEDFTLLRAAELTIEKGYKYFEILEWNKWISSREFDAYVVGHNVAAGHTANYHNSRMKIKVLKETFAKRNEIQNALEIYKIIKGKYRLEISSGQID